MGSKGGGTTIGYWYKIAYHMGLGIGPMDAFLEFRGGDKTAWSGELMASGTISINQPNLWGGESDQGGIVGDVDVMFGEATQMPNAYLLSTFGEQTPAWRGLSTVAFKGGKYGALNPYPQAASYKGRWIIAHWEGECWYPEKAVVPLVGGDAPAPSVIPYTAEFKYQVEAPGSAADYSAADYDDSAWSTGPGGFGNLTSYTIGTNIPAGEPGKAIWLRKSVSVPVVEGTLTIKYYADDGAWLWVNGVPHVVAGGGVGTVTIDLADLGSLNAVIALKVVDTVPSGSPTNIFAGMDITVASASSRLGMNPAHVLYYSRTNSTMGRTPIGQMNDASWRAAADWYHAQGFGICTEYDPAAESPSDFDARIQRVAGASVNRSLVDGQYYIDIANGEYDIDDLEILTDADVLDFSEQVTLLDGGVNSLAVKYFDPAKKEDAITPPVQALGLIDAFGTISQTNEYPEIPTGDLALRVAERDLRAVATPIKALNLKTTDATKAWRPNQYKRVQLPKRGIADLVVIVGDISTGTLKSGAISLTLTQDVYSLGSTTYVEIEPGIDTRPDQTPSAIVIQGCCEAPYIEVVAALSRADLQALPADVGFLLGWAADPANSRNFSMVVAPDGGSYWEVAAGDWSPTATLVEAAGPADDHFTIAGGALLDQFMVGMPVLWDGEVGRIDAIDLMANTIQIGRGCADTVPALEHAAGSRLWLLSDHVAADTTEYTSGETVAVKLLTNTGSQQMALEAAAVMSLTFGQRQVRPYPPGRLRINGDAYPAITYGPELSITFAHRDRVLQANQLIDTEAADIGPETGTTYTLRGYVGGVLDATLEGEATSPITWTPSTSGFVRIELSAVRDGIESWQAAVAEFDFYVSGDLAIVGSFPAGFVGVPYDAYLTLSGGGGIYALTGGTGVVSGALPAGLSLSIASGNHLRLSGTPTTTANSTFTVGVISTDSQHVTSDQEVAISQRYGEVLKALNPTWYVTLGDTPPTTVAVAEVGSNGTYVGTPTLGQAALIPGDPATCMYSNANAKRASVPNLWDGTGDFTVTFVVKTSVTAEQWAIIDQTATSSSSARMAVLFGRGSTGAASPGQICLFNYDGSTNRHFATTDTNISDDNPHQVILGRKAGVGFIYVDGISKTCAGAVATGKIVVDSSWGIGQSPAFATEPLTAYSGHFALWKRALSAAECAQLFAATGLPSA